MLLLFGLFIGLVFVVFLLECEVVELCEEELVGCVDYLLVDLVVYVVFLEGICVCGLYVIYGLLMFGVEVFLVLVFDVCGWVVVVFMVVGLVSIF